MPKLPGAPCPEQIFVIGDIHGQHLAFEAALQRIAAAPRTGLPTRLVFTGDIIDRGPGNLRCVELLAEAKELAGVDEVTFLPGNHELLFRDALIDPVNNSGMWLMNGGLAVLEEVDNSPQAVALREAEGGVPGTEQLVKLMRAQLAPLLDLTAASPGHLRIGDLLFVHAGISPTAPMQEFLAQPQDEHARREHWAWIRSPFLEHEGPWPENENLVVVHGHTPHNQGLELDAETAPEFLDRVETHRRICVDAGAASRDQVAILEISGSEYRLDVTHARDLAVVEEPCEKTDGKEFCG